MVIALLLGLAVAIPPVRRYLFAFLALFGVLGYILVVILSIAAAIGIPVCIVILLWRLVVYHHI